MTGTIVVIIVIILIAFIIGLLLYDNE